MSPRAKANATARPARPGRSKWGRGLRIALALVWATSAVGASPPQLQARADRADADAPNPAGDREQRIRELETAIARDEEALRVLISTGRSGGDDPLLTSAEIREIAHRLPALQDELRGLLEAREESGARAGP